MTKRNGRFNPVKEVIKAVGKIDELKDEFLSIESDVDDLMPKEGSRAAQLMDLANSLMERYTGPHRKSVYEIKMGRVLSGLDTQLGRVLPLIQRTYKGEAKEIIESYESMMDDSIMEVRSRIKENSELRRYIIKGEYPHLKACVRDILTKNYS